MQPALLKPDKTKGVWQQTRVPQCIKNSGYPSFLYLLLWRSPVLCPTSFPLPKKPKNKKELCRNQIADKAPSSRISFDKVSKPIDLRDSSFPSTHVTEFPLD
jgi:hypothetical protein